MTFVFTAQFTCSYGNNQNLNPVHIAFAVVSTIILPDGYNSQDAVVYVSSINKLVTTVHQLRLLKCVYKT